MLYLYGRVVLLLFSLSGAAFQNFCVRVRGFRVIKFRKNVYIFVYLPVNLVAVGFHEIS